MHKKFHENRSLVEKNISSGIRSKNYIQNDEK